MPSITETMRSVVPEASARRDLRAEKSASEPKPPQSTDATSEASDVELSDQVVQAIDSARFDAAKVEALRLAIMEGNYPLDAKRIAENMVDLERMIG